MSAPPANPNVRVGGIVCILLFSGAAFAAPPENDNFTNAAPISGASGVYTAIDTTEATAEPGEPAHAERGVFHSVWWTYTAPTNGILEVDTLDSDEDFDSILGIYAGSALSNLTGLASNDDNDPDGYNRSRLSFEVMQGETVRIAVDGFNGDTGPAVLSWTLHSVEDAPANDHFTNAIVIAGSSGTNVADTTLASAEPGEPAHAGSEPLHSVWWQFTAPANGALSLDTGESPLPLDTVLGVYTGSLVSSLTEIISNDDDPDQENRHSRVVLEVIQGVTYRIAVDGYDGATGFAVLRWELAPLDGDGDGAGYVDEWIADTDPNNSNDWLRITGFDGSAVFFESSANRIYALFQCTNLAENVWIPVTEEEFGTGGPDSLPATTTAPAAFYKVTVRLPLSDE